MKLDMNLKVAQGAMKRKVMGTTLGEGSGMYYENKLPVANILCSKWSPARHLMRVEQANGVHYDSSMAVRGREMQSTTTED